MRILLTGRSGQVGSALERALAPVGELAAFDRKDLDLFNPQEIKRRTEEIRPDIIVNAAAYTAVDRAESEHDAAFTVNAAAVRVLAAEAKKRNALLVHYSTDFVFDGEKHALYVEFDPPNPLNVYGQSKLAGEREIAASGCRHFIFRTSWVYGPGGRNFARAILAAARDKPELRVVDDQHGAPTSSRAIAEATARALSGPDLAEKPNGIYHMSAAGRTTWCGFAKLILESAGLKVPIAVIRSDEYPLAAKRPKNSLLDNSRLAATFGIALRDWREDVPGVVAAIQ